MKANLDDIDISAELEKEISNYIEELHTKASCLIEESNRLKMLAAQHDQEVLDISKKFTMITLAISGLHCGDDKEKTASVAVLVKLLSENDKH